MIVILLLSKPVMLAAMHFELLQMISLNGQRDKPNDDRCGSMSGLAWVIDGATDLGPPGLLGSHGGASWLASAASTAFAMTEEGCIQETCARVFTQIEDRFDRQKKRAVNAAWETPKAAFGAAQLEGNTLSVAWAADCPILLISGDTAVWCTGAPDTSAEMADARALGEGIGASDLSEEALEDRRAHRSQPRHEALSPDAQASARITRYAQQTVRSGDEILLMSDGFASILTDYSGFSLTEFVPALRTLGLSGIAQDIRRIERDDAQCLRFPRFKVSDDATAIWLKVVP